METKEKTTREYQFNDRESLREFLEKNEFQLRDSNIVTISEKPEPKNLYHIIETWFYIGYAEGGTLKVEKNVPLKGDIDSYNREITNIYRNKLRRICDAENIPSMQSDFRWIGPYPA